MAADRATTSLPLPRRDVSPVWLVTSLQTTFEAVPLTPLLQLRAATVVVPDTGEQVKRTVTLRDPKVFGQPSSSGQPSNERTPLLSSRPVVSQSWVQWVWTTIKTAPHGLGRFLWEFITSRDGQGVLKCSLAYIVGTMAVFVPLFRNGFFLGPGDAKHLVANITIWFHPARSTGSMHYGTTLAFLFWLFSAMVAYGSMAVVVFFENQDLIRIGQAIILVVSCGGGLGFLVWVKQRVNDPLINVSCTIAALPIVSVVTKDPAIQQGFFSSASITSVLYMLIMAILISTLVNILVRPVFARTDLRDNLLKATTAYATILAGITSGFLSGSEEDLKHSAVKAAETAFNDAYGAFDNNLWEARWEHCLLGTEKRYEIEQKLVKCMQRLAQDIGGLRSAASIEFYLLAESVRKGEVLPDRRQATSDSSLTSPISASRSPVLVRDFAADNRQSDEFPLSPEEQRVVGSPASQGSAYYAGSSSRRESAIDPDPPLAASAGHVFATFIEFLGPPMVRKPTYRSYLNMH